MTLCRPIRPPFNVPLTETSVQDDGLLEVRDHEGKLIAVNLSPDQHEMFMTTYMIGITRGAALEREALIFEYTRN
jgi:hypothetical protein